MYTLDQFSQDLRIGVRHTGHISFVVNQLNKHKSPCIYSTGHAYSNICFRKVKPFCKTKFILRKFMQLQSQAFAGKYT